MRLNTIGKILFVLMLAVFTVCIVPAGVFSQEKVKEVESAETTDDKKYSITFYPLPLIMNWLSAEGEIALSKNVSLALEAKHWSFSLELDHEKWSWKRTQIGPGVRYYPNRALDGFFLGMYGSVTKISARIDDTSLYGSSGSASATGFALTGWLGWKWQLSNVVLELSTGYEYENLKMNDIIIRDSYGNTNHYKVTDSVRRSGWSGLGAGIGICF